MRLSNFYSILEIISSQSEVKPKKRKRKVVVVKKPSGGVSEIDSNNSKQQRGSKVFVKRVKKLRDVRKDYRLMLEMECNCLIIIGKKISKIECVLVSVSRDSGEHIT